MRQHVSLEVVVIATVVVACRAIASPESVATASSIGVAGLAKISEEFLAFFVY